MGNATSTSETANQPDLSSSDSSSDSEQEMERNDVFEGNISMTGHHLNYEVDTDAVHLSSTNQRCPDLQNIMLPKIRDIANYLEEYEQVSLIFLLSENVQYCLNLISLYEWAERENDSGNLWQGPLLESLTIIQNFQIPKRFGFIKSELLKEFFPYLNFFTKYLTKFKKTLYLICEELNEEDEGLFLNHVETDFRKKGLIFKKFPYLEMYFSYFLKIGYITQTNLRNCMQIFKIMGLDNSYDKLETFHKEDQSKTDSNGAVEDPHSSGYFPFQSTSIGGRYVSLVGSDISDASQDNTATSGHNVVSGNMGHSVATQHIVLKNIDTIYDMTKKKMCFIIDQENFYKEIDEEFKHLLPEPEGERILSRRYGTSIDSKKLEKTFRNKGFEVKLERNLTHLRIIDKLRRVVDSIDENNCSCFFVCILSHGDEGVVYGCNSCYVEVSTIIEMMCHKKLKKIPKVLIIQSCQGPSLQIVERLPSNGDIDTDGPVLKGRPNQKTPDFLIFWSTVPGFSSIRNKVTGTWFIQSLCNHLNATGVQQHFEDICTDITAEITNKTYQPDDETECFMVPLKQSTLTKKLYL